MSNAGQEVHSFSVFQLCVSSTDEYLGTLQVEALALVAAKMRSALMIEGDLPEDGLAALEGDGQDVFLALARRMAGSGADGQSLEALFAQARAVEAEADDYLVNGGWEAEISGSPAAGSSPCPADAEVPDLWQRVLMAAPPTATDMAPGTVTSPRGRVVSFEDLERLVRRPRPRREPVPEGQLALFDT